MVTEIQLETTATHGSKNKDNNNHSIMFSTYAIINQNKK